MSLTDGVEEEAFDGGDILEILQVGSPAGLGLLRLALALPPGVQQVSRQCEGRVYSTWEGRREGQTPGLQRQR